MPDRPNILFLFSDEHSFRCLSRLDPAGSGEPVRTPTLDRLAAQGVAFENAYCQVPLCTPSRICMLTGVDPIRSGGWDNWSMLHPDRPTMASTLADAGYATALLGKMHLGGDRQFVGFDRRPYGDLTGDCGHQPDPPLKKGAGMGMRSRTADAGVTSIPETLLQEHATAYEAVSYIREQQHAQPDRPWFVCASFSRPHFPLTAPRRFFERYWPDGVTEPKVGRTGDTADHPMTRGMAKGFRTEEIDRAEMSRARAGYFACVDYLDQLLGDMLATLERDGLLDNTVIAYSSDHGELMGEHGMWWKNSWHEGATHVPLIVSTPEQRRGGGAGGVSIQTPVSLADLYPTFCGLGGAAAPGDLDGVDLSECIGNGAEPSRGPVVGFNPTPRWGEGTQHVFVRDGRYKFVKFASAQPDLLFDLVADPLEQRNLIAAPTHAEAANRLAAVAAAAWDFDAADAACRAWARQTEAHRLQRRPVASKNFYHLPDGRVVGAEDALYDPREPFDDPAAAIADWPTGRPAIR